MELSSVPTDAELFALAGQVAGEVQRCRLMLVTAESCSGGWIAKTLTDLPGSSAWFDRGFVTYSYAAKTELLGVPCDLLATRGAVSEQVAIAMAEGAIVRSTADWSVAITGIAGSSARRNCARSSASFGSNSHCAAPPDLNHTSGASGACAVSFPRGVGTAAGRISSAIIRPSPR